VEPEETTDATSPSPTETTEAAPEAASAITVFEVVTHAGSRYLQGSMAGLKRYLKEHPPKGAHVVYRCETPSPSVASLLAAYNGIAPARRAIVATAGEVPMFPEMPDALRLFSAQATEDDCLQVKLIGPKATVKALADALAPQQATVDEAGVLEEGPRTRLLLLHDDG
jgi:hypothetical protein